MDEGVQICGHRFGKSARYIDSRICEAGEWFYEPRRKIRDVSVSVQLQTIVPKCDTIT